MCIHRTEDIPALCTELNWPKDNLNKNLCNDHCNYVQPEKIKCLNEYNKNLSIPQINIRRVMLQ